MFVDPASISSGWAVFEDKQFIASGSIGAPKKLVAIERLSLMYVEYEAVREKYKPDEVHIEQFGGNPSHLLHWSVGVLGVALKTKTNTVAQDVPVSSWQKFTNWHGDREPLDFYKDKVQTEDELAAIGIGIYWVGAKC